MKDLFVDIENGFSTFFRVRDKLSIELPKEGLAEVLLRVRVKGNERKRRN